MSWLFWLGIAVLLGVVAAVTGIKPRGTRPVARTRLMGVGRFALLVLIAILLFLAYRARTGT
ncbi:MAG TPA: hypothetical protein VGQ32_11540 [Thermoanaerobaculia bacterium]|jgi:hypothetical protein|nr:hypothetical protein [Thermoanaerobaculia bacterium]